VKAKLEAEAKAREAVETTAKREAEEREKQAAEAKAKEEAEFTRVAEACAAMGRPMGSSWCWTLSNDDIAAGEVGTVVGILQEQGKVVVKFSKVTWPMAPDQLVAFEAFQKREAVRFITPP
jgi:uncharacterized membrane protein YqiK